VVAVTTHDAVLGIVGIFAVIAFLVVRWLLPFKFQVDVTVREERDGRKKSAEVPERDGVRRGVEVSGGERGRVREARAGDHRRRSSEGFASGETQESEPEEGEREGEVDAG
jgi:hypothetical protein